MQSEELHAASAEMLQFVQGKVSHAVKSHWGREVQSRVVARQFDYGRNLGVAFSAWIAEWPQRAVLEIPANGTAYFRRWLYARLWWRLRDWLQKRWPVEYAVYEARQYFPEIPLPRDRGKRFEVWREGHGATHPLNVETTSYIYYDDGSKLPASTLALSRLLVDFIQSEPRLTNAEVWPKTLQNAVSEIRKRLN